MGEAVVGPVKNAGTARQMPVEIGGIDSNGILRTLVLGTDGKLSLGGATVEIGEIQLLGADGLTLAKVLNGALLVTAGAGAATDTFTTASVTNTNTTVLAANTNRMGATVYNESGAICYLKLGATATLTAYTLQVAVGGYYEVPFGYNGLITGITASGTAVCRVAEITA